MDNLDLKIRQIDKNYTEITIELDRSTHDLGFFSKSKLKDLKEHLEGVVSELNDIIGDM